MQYEKCLRKELCDVSKFAHIHKSADPLSVWAFLGEELIAKLLYLPAFKMDSSIIILGVNNKDLAGFIVIVKKESQRVRLEDKEILFLDLIKIIVRLLLKPKVLFRAILVECFRLRCRLLRIEEAFEIHSMMIRSEFQNMGHGSQMIYKAIEEIIFTDRNIKKVFVKTFGAQSRNFYEKHGFVVDLHWKFLNMEITSLSFEIPSNV